MGSRTSNFPQTSPVPIGKPLPRGQAGPRLQLPMTRSQQGRYSQRPCRLSNRLGSRNHRRQPRSLVPGHVVPGVVLPHGYSRCWLPPAAAYSHSASLGRKPPSQMQNAYASYQFTQLIGRFSWLPAVAVHVAYGRAGHVASGSRSSGRCSRVVPVARPSPSRTSPGSRCSRAPGPRSSACACRSPRPAGSPSRRSTPFTN